MAELLCALCRSPLAYIHGHAACVRQGCPLYGVNQAECCSGETVETGPLTADVAAITPALAPACPPAAPSSKAPSTARTSERRAPRTNGRARKGAKKRSARK